MTPALTPNPLLRRDIPAHRELMDAGGQWVVEQGADPAAVVREAQQHDVAALSVTGKDLSFLAELPELEHLRLGDAGDIGPAASLPRLRSFEAVGWDGGRIDATGWPRLQRFAVGAPPRGGGVESVYAHPTVEVLGLNRFAGTELTEVTAPRLRELRLSSPKLESLTGLEAHADTLEVLVLSGVPRLRDLSSLAAMTRLEVLGISSARGVTTLDEVAAARGLRLLDLGDQRGVESLGPLAGHPSLEYVLFQKTADMSLAALRDLPRLRAVGGYRSRDWTPDLSTFPDLVTFAEEDDVSRDYAVLRLRY
ncbi:leucine-rich repeat domain-containing protein [Phycicoccus flavus]|uniref:leucine-rich repeat domain-containing protein n=1 Tax=Phycicoccus flavus TaxID=2502783 RepID=UPI000FEBD825|nr:leucine-rich repeat domain-containing protein [Phycicoccus flavus]NHA66555.1 leucine-rich repeat domain-containing protein [Phycicoccus flavus]